MRTNVDNNVTGQDAGATGADSQAIPDAGAQGAAAQPSGTPDGQGGAQTDPRDAKIQELSGQVKALNQAVVDARRAGRQQQPVSGEGDNPFETPEGQYAMSIQVATNKLRSGLEGRLALYPELPAEEAQRIRMSPWGFIKTEDLYFQGDWENALDEIEQSVADRVEQLAANSNPSGEGTPAPATVNNNPAPEAPEANAAPGSAEDEDPWTMPMDKLEKKKNEAVVKLSQPQ